MFAARSIRPAVSVARTQVAHQQQQAGMATLKEIEQRLKSVKNIEKITKVSHSLGWEGGVGLVDVKGKTATERTWT